LQVPFQCEVAWQVEGKLQPYVGWVFDEVELDREEPY
jgi:hypothetical protein